MSIRWLVLAALMTTGLTAGAVGGAPADSVSIDAVITDGQARPLRDLRPADFELTDAGEPREVANVRLQSGGSRLLAIFLDEFHVQPGEHTLRARRALSRFVDTELRADDTLAIMRPLDPLNAIQLTQDRDAMHRAIESFDGRKGDYAPRTAFEENFMSRAPREADAARAQVVTAALQALALRLGESREGRKAIVLVSEGFSSALPLAMVYAANRHGVSIYPISPGVDDSSMLRTLAEQTGGNFSVNQPDLKNALARVVVDLDAYYVVTYRVPQSGDGKYHPVQLRVKRADASVKARSGYWAANATLLRPSTGPTPTSGRIAVRPPHSSPYIRPWIGMSRGPGGATTVTVVWEPGLAPPRNQRVVSVVLTATAEDGRVLFQNQIRAADVDGNGVVITGAGRATFDAPPGYVSLEMAVHNGSAAPLDHDYRGIPIPDLRVARPTFATPHIVRTRGARAFADASADADAVPAATRTFSRSERLLVRIPVYGASETTPDVTATLLNRRGAPMRRLDRVPAGLPPGIVQFDLPLSSLAPDEYRIEFVAANGSGPRDEAKETLVFQVTN